MLFTSVVTAMLAFGDFKCGQSDVRCAISIKYIPVIEILLQKKKIVKYLTHEFYITQNDSSLDILG